jgi:hypothetical protein
MNLTESAIAGAVRGWYSEIKNDYNYETGTGNGKVVGHFQAVVWSSTTKLGCGINIQSGDGTYVTAHYSPASHASADRDKLAPLNVKPRKAPGVYFTRHVGQIYQNFSHSCGLVLSADILQKVASSLKNAKVSIFHRKSAENASLRYCLLGENLLNMTSVRIMYIKANFHSGKLSVDWNGQENLSLSCELRVGTNDLNTKKNFLVRSNPRIIFMSGN